MIKQGAKLHAQRIPIECLQVKLHGQRYSERLNSYIAVMTQHPENDILLHVTPSDTHLGMYCILDGHHRYIASIMTGRRDALCIVIDEEGEATPSAPFEEWHDEAIRERIPHVRPRTDYRRYREMGHNQVGALLMVIENLVYAGRSAVIEDPPRDEVKA